MTKPTHWFMGPHTITRERALAIQAEQCAHYEQVCPGITALVAEHTDAEKLEPGVEYDVVVVNRCIPRGGAIERLCGIEHVGGM